MLITIQMLFVFSFLQKIFPFSFTAIWSLPRSLHWTRSQHHEVCPISTEIEWAWYTKTNPDQGHQCWIWSDRQQFARYGAAWAFFMLDYSEFILFYSIFHLSIPLRNRHKKLHFLEFQKETSNSFPNSQDWLANISTYLS